MTDEARMADDGCTTEASIICLLCDREVLWSRVQVFWKTIEPGRHFRSIAICDECVAVVQANEPRPSATLR